MTHESTMKHRRPLAVSILTMALSLAAAAPADAVVGETRPQYQQRYGRPTHEMQVDPGHPGLIYVKKPYVIFAAFAGDRSVGEMIFKGNGMSDVDIAELLKQNSPGWKWRKENLVLGPGDAETMKSQGVLKLEMWSRTDGKSFATHLRTLTGQGKDRTEIDTLLVGTQEGVDLVARMGKMNQQWVPKPVK